MRSPTPNRLWPLGSLFLLLTLALPASGAAPQGPALAAEAHYLTALGSGRVLAEEKARHKLPPASLAKLMTTFLTFEALEDKQVTMDARFRISKAVWRMGGSQMFLEVGERVSVRKLLTGMIVAGGNDAARALAEGLAGSRDSFVRRMNRRAEALGLDNTHFANPSGLPAPGSHTTAADMAQLARILVQRFPERAALFRTESIRHNGITQHNGNRLLGWLPGVDGLLTGFSEAAGYHLVTTADRDSQTLIGVLLGAPSSDTRFGDMQALINHGFRFYESRTLFTGDPILHRPTVWQGTQDKVALELEEPIRLTLPSHRDHEVSARAEIKKPVTAPIKAGETLGWLHITLGDQHLRHQPLVARQAIPAAGWIDQALDSLQLQWQTFWREQRQKVLANNDKPREQSPGTPVPVPQG